jgi:glycerol-3-phosphate acyltransferase PlsX
MKIALDVMGGDRAPEEIVKGAILAEQDFPDVEIVYFGDRQLIEKYYLQYASAGREANIFHSEHVIQMHDSPLSALKEKRNNSISRAVEYHKNGDARAFVSAGNTGACVAAATLQLRMLPGVQRPGIACTFPSQTGHSLVLDCGANVNARARHMMEYAVLGRAFRRLLHQKENASVGLLNIGEENAKGNDFTKEAHELLSRHREMINFIGNVEARDIFNGSVDVVVCEGFVGNSLLKGAEGLSKLFFSEFKNVVTQNIFSRLGGIFMKKGLLELKRKGDPNEFGGAPLLGVNGHVIISHGSSSAWGIRNALRTAREMILGDLNGQIQKELSKAESEQ